jgi:hypothetical protein
VQYPFPTLGSATLRSDMTSSCNPVTTDELQAKRVEGMQVSEQQLVAYIIAHVASYLIDQKMNVLVVSADDFDKSGLHVSGRNTIDRYGAIAAQRYAYCFLANQQLCSTHSALRWARSGAVSTTQDKQTSSDQLALQEEWNGCDRACIDGVGLRTRNGRRQGRWRRAEEAPSDALCKDL